VKAFYGLATLVPFCAFIVLGWQMLTPRSRILELAITAFLIFFSINSFAAFWIRPTTAQHIYAALRSISQSQPDRALSEASAAISGSPSNSSAVCFSAAVLEEVGQTSKAVAESERGLQLDPANADCHFQLGVSLRKQSDLTRALSEAQRAAELSPESMRDYDLIFALDRELNQNDEALAVAREALAVSPFNADLHYSAGLVAGQIGDFTAAVNQFAYALLLDPKKVEHEQKLRTALSFLQQSSNRTNAIRDLQPLAAASPKLLEILAPYRENLDSATQDRQ